MKTSKIGQSFLAISIILLFFSSTIEAQISQEKNDSRKNGYSDLWGKDGKNWKPSSRLPDVSFAGYDMGDSKIPNFPIRARLGQKGSKPNDNKGDGKELQELINSIQTPGTIIIPKGTWNINKRIFIRKSQIVLKGENGAVFKMNKSLREVDKAPASKDYAFNDAFFKIEGRLETYSKHSITKNTYHGSRTIEVANGVTFKPGDLVSITQTDSNDQSLFLYINGTDQKRGYWTRNYPNCGNLTSLLNNKDIFQFLTKVKSQQGNKVTLERPLPLNIRTKWTPKIAKINNNKTLRQCGMENLTFRMNGKKFGGHFTMDGSSAIFVRNLLNSWFRKITIIDADNGIKVENTNSSLFDKIIVTGDKRRNDRIGHHAIWATKLSGDNLFTNCEINEKYIHDYSLETWARQNVFSKCSGLDVNIDHHRGAPYSNVFTEMNLGKGTRPFESSGAGCVGPHTGRYVTFWNMKKQGNFPEFPHVTRGQYPQGGSPKDYNYGNGIGLKGTKLSSRSKSFEQYVEFTKGENLKNPNIYIAQRAKRFDGESNTSNKKPRVELTSPRDNQEFKLGQEISLRATASDSDGSIKKVDFHVNNKLFSTDPGSPFDRKFKPTKAGTYKIEAIAFDNKNATSNDFVTIVVKKGTINPPTAGCNFGTPRSSGIGNIDISYTNIFKIGNGGPDVRNIRKFSINFSATYNDLYQFAINTNNGKPAYYVDFSKSSQYQLKNKRPEITLKNTNIKNLDGSYWVTKTASSFILVSKSGGFSLHFSSNNSKPSCDKNADPVNSATIKVYPVPVINQITISDLSNDIAEIQILDTSGKKLQSIPVHDQTTVQVEAAHLAKGMYFVKTISKTKTTQVVRFIK